MIAKEYWERYDENIDKLVLFEETCSFFSQEISNKDLEEYDFIHIVLDVIGNCLSEKIIIQYLN